MEENQNSGRSVKATSVFAFVLVCLGAGAVSLAPFNHWRLGIAASLFTALVAIAWYDFDHYRIPNWLSLPLIAAGLVFPIIWPGYDLIKYATGAIVGYGSIWGLRAFWLRYRGKEGIGLGDAKLLAAAGAWLGPLALPFVTLAASTGALLWIGMRSVSSGKALRPDQRIPFGPFIALGFWTIWLFQEILPIRL